MLKLNVFEKSPRKKNMRAWFGFCVGLMLAPVLNVWADPTLTYSNVFSFDLSTAGQGGVVEASVGGVSYLYGTVTSTSRTYGGAIYRVDRNGGAPQTIYQLKSTDGYVPDSKLLAATDPSDGITYLYGETTYWPASTTSLTNGWGTIFRVTLDGARFETLHVFSPLTTTGENTDGIYPAYGLIDGGDGYAYGVTQQGGLNGTGTLFRIKLDGNDFQVLHAFSVANTDGTNADGLQPSAGLTLGPGARLYGVAQYGGTGKIISSAGDTGAGVVFSMNPDGTDFETIYNFSDLDTTGTNRNLDGATPKGDLVYDELSGLLIGTASTGGSPVDGTAQGFGTVFSLNTDGTPDGTTFTTLHSFTGTDGSLPFGRLIVANDGLIYGITSSGTSTTAPISVYGTVYSIDTLGNFNVAHGFDLTEVSGTTTAGIIQATDGYFYGSGTSYGACGYGAVFRLSLNGTTTSTPYAACTDIYSTGGGGSMSTGWVWLLCALGVAPPVRRRLFGFN